MGGIWEGEGKGGKDEKKQVKVEFFQFLNGCLYIRLLIVHEKVEGDEGNKRKSGERETEGDIERWREREREGWGD